MKARHIACGLALAAGTASAWASGGLSASGDGPGTIVAPAAASVETNGSAALSTTTTTSATTLAASADVIRHDIAATTVDSTATQQANSQTGVPNKHLVLVPTSPSARKQRLFLFILGTNSSETKEQEIVYAGAKRGYHAIALAFPNYDAVAQLCFAVPDTQCTGKVREEILTGVNVSNRIAIQPQDALETRLKKLLVYLNAQYPTEGWGSFLQGSEVAWSTISAVGHSQGAGHVAYLAKRHAMYRAVMISGVADVTLAGQTAPWLSLPNLTPAASQYGFSHTGDTVVPIARAEASWNAIGLNAFGAKQSVDGQSPDYSGSHKLTTSVALPAGVNAHLAMADDDKLPLASDGTPVFDPVWALMAFP